MAQPLSPFVLCSFLFWLPFLHQGCFALASTNQQDVNVLKVLKHTWSPTLPWNEATDPCQTSWLGVFCDTGNTTVTNLILPAQGISGFLPPEIGSFVTLQVLDLSYNSNLTGSLPLQLFRLTNLTQLYLQNCGFYGALPQDLGNLINLNSLSLNHNFFTGSVPHSIGQLSQLVWLDLSSNKLSGNLPLSLARLTQARHFHLQANSFSGVIPAGIFHSKLPLIHLLLHNNSFEGPIPTDVGSLSELTILRLDHNSFTTIPGSVALLPSLCTLHLDHNNVSGDVPDLSSMVNMQILSLGYNQFSQSSVPLWLNKFPKLSAVVMEAGNLQGTLPATLFSLADLALVRLGYNNLNGTLDLRMAGPSLIEVDLEKNSLSGLLGNFSGTLNLQGNPLCLINPNQEDNSCDTSSGGPVSSLPPSMCNCQRGYAPNPSAMSESCLCAYPLTGILVFTALKVTLDSKIVPVLKDAFVRSTPLIDTEDQLSVSLISGAIVNISIFPKNAETWDANQANAIIALLSSKAILLPGVGPYEYLPYGPYTPGTAKGTPQLNASVEVGIGSGVAAFAAVLVVICGYALLQKKRAEKAEEISKPFVSWVSMREEKGGAPKLKGSRLFALAELKGATRNFHRSHEIGVGGYGKVYKGVLPSGEQIAIKKAQARSHQGAAEFKNEIELLSRVHHKNLVCLVGFCFEERMLVYEYVPNGTLHDSLSGRSNVNMDWQRRLSIALGSARGLAYLHTEANPPVIHRDVKSSNILLDQNLVAKVADFGLSRLAPEDAGTGILVSTQVKGTLGYLDPEYCTTQRLSDKSDVYSFGVVLLELITSKQPIDQGKHIVREVRTAWQRGALQAVLLLLDPHIRDCPKSELSALLDIALRCVEEEAAFRPSMKQVAKEIEAIRDESSRISSLCDKESGVGSGIKDPTFHYSGGYAMDVIIEPK